MKQIPCFICVRVLDENVFYDRAAHTHDHMNFATPISEEQRKEFLAHVAQIRQEEQIVIAVSS